MERGGKVEVQTCSRNETCQSNSLQEVLTLSSLPPDVFDENLMLAWSSPKAILALSSAFKVGV